VRRWTNTEFNSDGSVRRQQSGARRRDRREGFWIGYTIERDGKPLPAMARADAEVFDTVNIGLGLIGRVEKGTRFFLERRKVAPDFWMISDQVVKFDARIMLVKIIQQENRSQRSEIRSKADIDRAAASATLTPARAKN
jgi:hypothetical protein